MKITQIRNATIKIEYNNTKFLIDPWLGPKEYMEGFEAGINSHIRQPRVELPFDLKDITNVDAVIVTHIHPDHWDEYAEKALTKGIKIFVQSQADQEFIKSKGFTNSEILEPDGIEYNGIKLYKTYTQHGKREIIEPICKKVNMPYDAMGVIFKSNQEKTLYLAGDTIWCEEVEQAIENFKPEIIIINACGASVLNGERLIMNEDDIIHLINKTPNSKIIASHMDTVSHLTVTRKDLHNLVEEKNLKNLLIPEDGETIILK